MPSKPRKNRDRSTGKRVQYTDEQRLAVRKQNKVLKDRKATSVQERLCTWFTDLYRMPIKQYQISKFLSAKYNYLDEEHARLNAYRKRKSQWPKLDDFLNLWQLKANASGVPVTGDILKMIARDNFGTLYPAERPPAFSNGWLEGFKSRHGIKTQKKLGEDADVDEKGGEEAMQHIRRLTASYDLDCIYNMDETGLYWKMVPDRTLASEHLSGVKSDKARISIAVTVNGDGSLRPPLWIVGKAAVPVCMKGINKDALGAYWRSNKKAWMTGAIMREYLFWFEGWARKHHSGKKVLLLMDNFSGHTAAVEQLKEEQSIIFDTFQVAWLPPNTTSRYQPCDQGIISTFKSLFRRYWCRYLVEEYEASRQARKTMNVLKAVQWLVKAWDNDIKDSTIANCFRKSTVKVDTPYPDAELAEQETSIQEQTLVSEIEFNCRMLQGYGVIQEAMNIQRFLNPVEENQQLECTDLAQDCLNEMLDGEEAESDEEAEDILPVTTKDALFHLENLEQWFQRSCPESNFEDMQWLTRKKASLKDLIAIERSNAPQTTLDSWVYNV